MSRLRKHRAIPFVLTIALALAFAGVGAGSTSAQASRAEWIDVKSGATVTPAFPSAQQNAAAAGDPVLQAMLAELVRSKAQLKMDNVAQPYYIEYRLTEIDEYDGDAAFGDLRLSQRTRQRRLRAVVRIGDYKQDSYFGPGQGIAENVTIENDIYALRHSLWMLTDVAYKQAVEALASKQAMLKEINPDQNVDDFAHAQPQIAVGPGATLALDESRIEHMLKAATALYREEPEIQMMSASAQFSAHTEYFVNTEGSITRSGRTTYALTLSGQLQAKDGMQIARTPQTLVGKLEEVPSEAKFVADAHTMLMTLKALRDAPVVDEEYRGPVLLSPDAASDVLATLIGDNLGARKPPPGRGGRTVGVFASSYKSRVLPNFITIVDDPTQSTFQGHSLVGSYEFDNEGVRVAPVTVVQKGELVNYLIGRQPIPDFTTSNGHGRAAPGSAPQPHYGVLTLTASESLSPAALKQKLIQMCKDMGKTYGYRIETFGGLTSPRLLYRVYVSDGHEELVRGALLNELDVRGLRNDLIAVGNDLFVSNRSGNILGTVISPSMLFDELEVRRDDRAKGKLPEYPAPPISSPGRQ
jgi:TldD protein